MIQARTVRLWYRLHKWTSLICTVFLLTACTSGLPLIFEDELGDLLQPHQRPAALPADAPLASLDRMVEQTQLLYPHLHPYALGWDDDEPRVFVNMTATPNPTTAADFSAVVFDAHTGKRIDQPKFGGSFLDLALRFHRDLFLGTFGTCLMTVMATCFVVSLISGALVYGPFMRNLRFGTYRTSSGTRLRWFDLHNLIGIVTLSWMLVVGATGWMNELSGPLFALWRAQTLPPLIAPYKGKPMPSRLAPVDLAVAAANRRLPTMETSSVLFPNAIVGSPRHYVVWMRGRTPVTSRLFTPALIDAATGDLTAIRPLPWYLRLLEVSRPFHFGDYGGIPLKILWAVFDFAAITVLLSGIYLWLSRRNRGLTRELDLLVEQQTGAHA